MIFDNLDDEALASVLVHQQHSLVIVKYPEGEVAIECDQCKETIVTFVSDECHCPDCKEDNNNETQENPIEA